MPIGGSQFLSGQPAENLLWSADVDSPVAEAKRTFTQAGGVTTQKQNVEQQFRRKCAVKKSRSRTQRTNGTREAQHG
ncbi:hypothetical protein A7M48_19115 [Acinetobacter baumannii]|nr:hypothetical protein A7M48_19115 [Acinetobacter baumannii]